MWQLFLSIVGLGFIALFAIAALELLASKFLVTKGGGQQKQRWITGRTEYWPAQLLTPTEAQFYRSLDQRLAVVAPHVIIFPKVRLGDLASCRRSNYAAGNRVRQKHVDFVLADGTSLVPLLVVELDDRSHLRRERAQRDEFVDDVMAQIGLGILHVRVDDVPDGLRRIEAGLVPAG